jgi:hypothetical protein
MILSRVLVTETGFGLVIGFISRLQLVTTNNYNTVPDLLVFLFLAETSGATAPANPP